jgi:glutamate-5-semialdehyde dehydrogenase
MQDFSKFINPVIAAKKDQFKFGEEHRHNFLESLAELLEKKSDEIIDANKLDLAKMDKESHLYDRLELTENRIHGMQESIQYINQLPYIIGQRFYSHTNSSGLDVSKVRVPFGVIGIIYESRPNVSIDCAALGVYSGNCVMLRGGSDAYESNKYLVSLIKIALHKADMNEGTVDLLPTDRGLVYEMLKAKESIDLVIARGGRGLIDFVQDEALMPAIETGAGVCHTYVHNDASVDMATNIISNAKISRPSVCNALDTVLIHKEMAPDLLSLLGVEIHGFKVKIYADEQSYELLKAVYPEEFLFRADDSDFGHEYLSLGMSVKIVEDMNEAIEHVSKYSSMHSEVIIPNDEKLAAEFINRSDAGAVYHNASSRFTDGFEFGLGAEIGVSTQKLHARGPMGLEELMTYKWVCRGEGQTR